MKICHIFPTLMLHDGPTNVLLGLLEALASSGIENTVISLRRPPAARDAGRAIEALGVRYIEIGMRRGILDPGSLSRLIRVLRTESPDVTQCNLFRGNVYGTIAAKLSGSIPTICVAHNIESYMTDERLESKFARRAEAASSNLATIYVAVSRAVAAALNQHLNISRVKVIHNGIGPVAAVSCGATIRAKLGIPKTALVIGSVGRLHPQKGYSDLIHAASALSRTVQNLQVLIVGEGAQRPFLEAECTRLGLSDRVTLLGFRTDVAEILPAVDIFAMTSYYEGLPIALLEAMRASLPCVVTDAGGMREAVLDGVTGYVVRPGDLGDLLSKLLILAIDAEMRLQMGIAAQNRFVQQFSASSMAKKYWNLYREIINTHRRDDDWERQDRNSNSCDFGENSPSVIKHYDSRIGSVSMSIEENPIW